MDVKMKFWILAIVAVLILTVYSVPTFYEACTHKKIIKVARTMSEDLLQARLISLKGTEAVSVRLIRTGRQGYVISSGTKVIKTVYLDQIEPSVVYSSLFDKKAAVIEGDSFVFNKVREPGAKGPEGHDSIFFNRKLDEAKGLLNNIVRIYIDKGSYNIKLFRVYEVKDNGDLVFKEI